jgi:hypothetical protein
MTTLFAIFNSDTPSTSNSTDQKTLSVEDTYISLLHKQSTKTIEYKREFVKTHSSETYSNILSADALIDSSNKHYMSNIKKKTPYKHFGDRKGLTTFMFGQCKDANGPNIWVYPNMINPWLITGFLVPQVGCFTGMPIFITVALPIDFPNSPPVIKHYTRIARHPNLNYNVTNPDLLVSTSCNSLDQVWGPGKICSDCDGCAKNPKQCRYCTSPECKAIRKTKTLAHYYPSMETLLTSFINLYTSIYVPQAKYEIDEVDEYLFHAVSARTLYITYIDAWKQVFAVESVIGSLDSLPSATPVYGKFINTSTVVMNARVLSSVPPASNFLKNLGYMWKSTGTVYYSSEPMSITSNKSCVFQFNGDIKDNPMSYVVSFILRSRDGGRIIRSGMYGYAATQTYSTDMKWFNHGEFCNKCPFAVWVTIAEDQFCLAIQDYEDSIPYLAGGSAVSRLSSIFDDTNILILDVLIKSYTTETAFLTCFPISKGIVCESAQPAAQIIKSRFVLRVRNIHRLSEWVKAHVDVIMADDLKDAKDNGTCYTLSDMCLTVGETGDPDFKYDYFHPLVHKRFELKISSILVSPGGIYLNIDQHGLKIRSCRPPNLTFATTKLFQQGATTTVAETFDITAVLFME